MLRHCFATYALRNGAKVELISKILGHSSVGITLDVYRTVIEGEIKAEHARFGPMGEKRLSPVL
jgi:site-specific recombinase XerD